MENFTKFLLSLTIVYVITVLCIVGVSIYAVISLLKILMNIVGV
jgi:hypothetical protein